MLRKIVDIANVTVSVLVGAYLVLLTLFGTEGLRFLPDRMVASWGWWFLLLFGGAALVAVNIRLMVEEYRAGGFRRNLLITTDQGTTEFSAPSLELLILRDLKAEPDIVDPAVTLRPRGEGKPMRCEVELKLRRQDDVIKRIDAIKKKVRDTVDRLIPGSLTVEVVVEVRDFVSESLRRVSREVRPEPGEFNGPVYADGGGSEGV